MLVLVVLYGCETWPLTLREEHRVKVIDNSAEENIWADEGLNTRKMKKIS
jgi:hypothetical protein